MAKFNCGDPKRIQHFTKVYEYAHTIGVLEKLDAETLKILDIASIMHDIGIRPSEEKYGRCDGRLQEQEGPAYAHEMMKSFPEISPEEAERAWTGRYCSKRIFLSMRMRTDFQRRA